jgi:hypothetical protein
VRTLDISVNNGNVTGLVGEGELLGYNGGSNSPVTNIKMNNPTKLFFDSANNQMLFSDTSNFRIRSINLNTGAENTLLGQGTTGAGNVEDEDPTNLRFQGPFAITSLNNFLLFLDNQGGGGTNRNCLVRALNRTGNSNSIFGTSILNNRVSTIAGDYTQCCGNFTGNNAQPRTVRLDMPEGLTTDGTNLFISQNQDHCVLRMTPDGTISQYIGLCGTEGDVNGVATGGSIRLRFPSSIFSDPRHPTNFFIADQTNQAANKIKYINLSGGDVVISGITVSNGQIGTVYTAGGYGYAVAAFDNQICFSSGNNPNGWQGSHNVQCRDRDNPIPSTTMLAGRPDGDQTRAGTPNHVEQEGVPATSSYLYAPYGLAFDGNGNLYIADRQNHLIRMVKRWW